RLETITKLYSDYNAAIKSVGTMLEIVSDEFQATHDHNPIHHIERRLKSPLSILEKLSRKGLEPSISNITANITDIAGLRIVCPYIKDIHVIADFFLTNKEIELIKERDYITKPKDNGYRSLHLVVRAPIAFASSFGHVPVEIQIRTIAMDMWASLEHEIRYKRGVEVPQETTERLKNCAEVLAEIDLGMQSIYHEMLDK
ncbi:MAG: GTP pyrophosphokinase family protein, partial [Clostridiales bacterium]|nr:GTP pyrophosphokinase family protein [Clostridiales bacterium]